MIILLCVVIAGLCGAVVLLFRFCRHLERGLKEVESFAMCAETMAIRARQVAARLQASRERGADVAGLRRRVEAMERDIDELDVRINKLTPRLPPDIACLNEHFKSRILVE